MFEALWLRWVNCLIRMFALCDTKLLPSKSVQHAVFRTPAEVQTQVKLQTQLLIVAFHLQPTCFAHLLFWSRIKEFKCV